MNKLIALPYRGFSRGIKRVRMGVKWLRNQLWPFGLLLRQLARAAGQASGITITVLVAAYSIGIPYLISAIARGLDVTPGLVVFLALGTIILSVPLSLVSGWFALKTADPETYSRILLGGRPEKEVLFTISRRIDRTCGRTLRLSTWAEKLLSHLEEEYRPADEKERREPIRSGWWRRWTDDLIAGLSVSFFKVRKFFRRSKGPALSNEQDWLAAHRDEIEVLVWWLRRVPHKMHTRLLRIETMKVRASAELDIPARRICDHVFQYSPAIHRDRLRKYVHNWGQILDARVGTDEEKRRLWDIVVQNLIFLNNTRRRRRYQSEILENRDLHTFIVQFASKHSTSGSLQTYAEALRYVGLLGKRRLSRSSGGAEEEIQAISTRLRFLYRKQRAHPGFDLHALLMRALRCMEPKLHDMSEVLDLLEELRNTSPEGDSKAPLRISESRLEAFRDLSYRFAALVDSSRKKISEDFKEICQDWLCGHKDFRYIVSHGFSGTVLSVLRNSLPEPGKLPDDQLPRLFFLLPDEKDSFDTRIMEYELKEMRTFRPFRNFAAGNEKHLLALLKDADQVLVLLGAECFDKERRMVHPRGFRPLLSTILEEMKGRVCRVLVVAESYKRNDDLLTADTRFYGQHFDRIDLYPPGLIHCVLTDKEILRSPYWP